MIYNFMQYLKSLLTTYSYSVNGSHRTSPNDLVIINETTSIPANYISRCDYTIQIISRAESPVTAKEQIRNVFDKVDKYWDVILPQITITLDDGSTVVYDEVKAYQMLPLQRPYWFGYDQNGLAQYVFNLKVTTK